MVDYQFLGLAAVVFAVMTRGSVLPVVAMTALVAVVLAGYEAGLRRSRRRRPDAAGPRTVDPPPSDTELTRWMPVIDRLLRLDD